MSQRHQNLSVASVRKTKTFSAKPFRDRRSVFQRLGPQLPPPTESSYGLLEETEKPEFESFEAELEAFKKFQSKIKLTAEQLNAELDEHMKNKKILQDASLKKKLFNGQLDFIITEMEEMGLNKNDRKVDRINFLLHKLAIL